MKLRNYQIKAVDAIFEAWQKFLFQSLHRRILLDINDNLQDTRNLFKYYLLIFFHSTPILHIPNMHQSR